LSVLEEADGDTEEEVVGSCVNVDDIAVDDVTGGVDEFDDFGLVLVLLAFVTGWPVCGDLPDDIPATVGLSCFLCCHGSGGPVVLCTLSDRFVLRFFEDLSDVRRFVPVSEVGMLLSLFSSESCMYAATLVASVALKPVKDLLNLAALPARVGLEGLRRVGEFGGSESSVPIDPVFNSCCVCSCSSCCVCSRLISEAFD